LRLLGIAATLLPAEGGDELIVRSQVPEPGMLLQSGVQVQVSAA
jgi:hypothetical protein